MTDYSTYDDMALVRVIANPGPESSAAEAFTILYRRYSENLYHSILSLVKDENIAEETVQETFARLWQKRESVSIDENVSGYLVRIGRNLVIDFFRKAKKDKTLLERLKEIASTEFVEPNYVSQEQLLKDQADLLARAISNLPPQRRKVFELCKLEGKSYQQVCEEMGISFPTVKDHMFKAKKSIRDFLSEEGDAAVILLILLGLMGD